MDEFFIVVELVVVDVSTGVVTFFVVVRVVFVVCEIVPEVVVGVVDLDKWEEVVKLDIVVFEVGVVQVVVPFYKNNHSYNSSVFILSSIIFLR